MNFDGTHQHVSVTSITNSLNFAFQNMQILPDDSESFPFGITIFISAGGSDKSTVNGSL